MVKIVEAPKNVPASEKAAALYTGIQKRNEAIKNKKKEIRSIFWLEESIKEQFGLSGIEKLKKIKINTNSPFLQFLKIIK